jgi:predicted component of type VI protein secretion system
MILPRMAKLVFTSGSSAGREVALGDFQVIGRLPSNAVPLPDDSGASRQHTRVYKAKGAFVALDLGSKNGTLVNGDNVEKAELKDGDVLTVGTTTFRFELEPADRAPIGGAKVGGDDSVEVGGRKGVGEKALLFTEKQGPGYDTLSWLRGDLGQRPFFFRLLLWSGVALLAAALFYWTYRVAAGD